MIPVLQGKTLPEHLYVNGMVLGQYILTKKALVSPFAIIFTQDKGSLTYKLDVDVNEKYM